MRILVISHTFPNPWEPYRDPHVARQISELPSECQVRALIPTMWTQRLRRWIRPSRIDRTRFPYTYPVWWYPPKLRVDQHGEWMWRSIRQRAKHLVRHFKPDLIYSPWSYPDGWAAMRLKEQTGLPLVIKSRGSDVLDLTNNPVRRKPTEMVLNAADQIVAVSSDLAKSITNLDIDQEKVHVVYNGVDRDRFRPGDRNLARTSLGLDDRNLLLFVGSLKPVKQVDVLLKACHLISQRKVPFQCHILGNGPLRTSLKTLTEKLNLTENVTFHGAMAASQLPDWYRSANLTVLPSRSEGVPNVLLESMSCGTPFVASNVGGIPEIASEPIDRLVPSGSPEALTRAILEKFKGPPHDLTQRSFQPTDWSTSAIQLKEVFENAINAQTAAATQSVTADCLS